MAVYKRGYQRYEGPRTSHMARLLVMPREAWRRVSGQRIVTALIAVSCIWPLLCALFIYVSNHTELWAGMGGDFRKLLAIDASFFLTFMKVQSVFSVLLAALAGPGLIAPDLGNQGLGLYFSRPISRLEYALAKMAALVWLLSLVTWVPGLALFLMQVSMAPAGWAAEHWTLGAAVVFGFWQWVALVALVALASSAWVRWRLIAGAAVLGYFFVLSGIGVLVNAIFRVEWGDLINPLRASYGLWCVLAGAELPRGLSLPTALLALALMGSLLALALEKRLRPVEVVR
jgi:ABC-2 type transport system permease protein